MKNFLMIALALSCLFVIKAFADTPAPTPVAAATTVTATPTPSAPSTGGLLAMVLAAVAVMNIALTAVQKIFAALGKGEPGILVTISKVVLAVATWIGSNPDLTKTPPAP